MSDRSLLSVTVLAGGPSAEREVSLESGAAVADALRRSGHRVRLADVSPDDLHALDAPADVIFPALHGAFGEDGTLQRILEQRGLAFVGSGSAASALAMDKAACKRRVAELGIPTPAYEVLDQARVPGIKPPAVVKPVDQGSSVGAHIARDAAALREAVRQTVEQFGRALVEAFIEGAEITIGMLDDRPLPAIRIRPGRDFYDYEAKYRDARTEYCFDTGLEAAVLEQLATLSLRAFEHIGCRHLARVDWIVDAAGQPWFLEINTLPGFTSHSLLPKAAARAGIGFEALCDRLVRMALRDRG